MGGGLLQLAAYGSENQYINGNPQITFFKIVYKRHTNFAMETIEVPLEGPDELSFTDSIRLKVKIPRNGDLIAHMYFRFKIPDSASDDIRKFYWTRQLGLSIIDYVNIYIGGQKIETLDGSYLDLTNQLTVSKSKQSVFADMIGDNSFMSYLASYKSGYYPGFDFVRYYDKPDEDEAIPGSSINKRCITKFYNSPAGIFERHFNIPLNFWFVRNPGLALPLIALQYHDVELDLQLKPAKDLYTILEDDKKYYYYEDEDNLYDDIVEIDGEDKDYRYSSIYTDKGPEYILELSGNVSFSRGDRIFQKIDDKIISGIVRFTKNESSSIIVLIPGELKFEINKNIYSIIPVGEIVQSITPDHFKIIIQNDTYDYCLLQPTIFSISLKIYRAILFYKIFGPNYNFASSITWNAFRSLFLADEMTFNNNQEAREAIADNENVNYTTINTMTGLRLNFLFNEHIVCNIASGIINGVQDPDPFAESISLIYIVENIILLSLNDNLGYSINNSLAQVELWLDSIGYANWGDNIENTVTELYEKARIIDDPIVISIVPNYLNLSTLPGESGSIERIKAGRERAAKRSNIIGDDNKGLKTWTPKIRTAPNPVSKQDHISNFLYGQYYDKTWDFEPLLDINYIFLDNEERRVFAEISHHYLIEQVVKVEKKGLQGESSVELETYHPVKEILFTASRDDNSERNEWLNNTTLPIKPGIGSPFDWQDHWWAHCCDVAEGIITNDLIIEQGPISFEHPIDGLIICDRFQELLFRFGPNGEAGDTALDSQDSILGFTIQERHSLYSLDVFKQIKEGTSKWIFTAAADIPRIDNDNYEIYRRNPLISARIKFNGQVREEMHRHEFYSQVQAYQYHTSNPNQPIYVYSFALNPEKYQPSGACNMSMIKTIEFDLNLKNTPISKIQNKSDKKYGNGMNVTREWLYNVDFFIIGYNILNIMGGMGGLTFAN